MAISENLNGQGYSKKRIHAWKSKKKSTKRMMTTKQDADNSGLALDSGNYHILNIVCLVDHFHVYELIDL